MGGADGDAARRNVQSQLISRQRVPGGMGIHQGGGGGLGLARAQGRQGHAHRAQEHHQRAKRRRQAAQQHASGRGGLSLLDSGAVKYDFQARRLLQAARGYTLAQLRRAVELCAETDYRMKSSGADNAALFQEAVLRIAAGECDA